jgi:hypothetical protein
VQRDFFANLENLDSVFHQEVKSILQKTNCSTLYYYNQ